MKKILVGGFILLSVFSFSQTTKENKIKDLLLLMGTEKNLEMTFSGMIAQYKEIYPDVPREYWDKVGEKRNLTNLVNLIVPIYSKHFEEKEIDDLLTFYKTPTGKKIIAKLPLIMNESMKEGEKWGRDLSEKIGKELEEKYQYSSPPPPMN